MRHSEISLEDFANACSDALEAACRNIIAESSNFFSGTEPSQAMAALAYQWGIPAELFLRKILYLPALLTVRIPCFIATLPSDKKNLSLATQAPSLLKRWLCRPREIEVIIFIRPTGKRIRICLRKIVAKRAPFSMWPREPYIFFRLSEEQQARLEVLNRRENNSPSIAGYIRRLWQRIVAFFRRTRPSGSDS